MALALDRRMVLAGLASSTLMARIGLAAPYAAPQQEKMVPVEGGRIYVRMNGDAASKRAPLLMIHGGPGGNHSAYLPFLALSAARPIILYDQLDSGRSDTPNDKKNWRVERFVAEIDAIRRAFGLEKLYIYGGSWGATIALEYTSKRPPGLAGTILQSPLISTRTWLSDTRALRRPLPATTQKTLDKCESPAPPPAEQCSAADEVFNSRFLRRLPRPVELEAYRNSLPMPFNQRIYEAMWGRTEFVSTGTLRNYDGEHLLERLTGARTLFVTGQYDEARPQTVQSFAARLAGSELAVIPGAGHAISIDRPDELVGLCRNG
jgi:proline iminopeptidase/L-proline amide hydrolase